MASVATKAFLLVVIAAAALGTTALGASYTVGAPAGSWDLRSNYTQWASNVRFQARDQVVFKYPRAAHNVVEVSKADYDACSSSSPLASFQTGDDVVLLPAAGSRYFVCGVPGHCDAGMKVRISVEAAATTGAPSPASRRALTPAAAPMPSARTPTGSAQQATPPSSSATSGVVASVGLCIGIVLAASLIV